MTISAVIPAHNCVATLARAIDSVLAQTHKANEIIVVDDGSTDATSEVAKMYPEVFLLRQKKMGFSSARNNGVMMAMYDWIAFLDADDTWHPEKLKEQVAYHRENRHCKVSATGEVRMRDGKEAPIPNPFQKPGEATFESCLGYCNIAASSIMMEKKLFDRLGGFDESMEVCEDYDLWLRVLREERICLINRELTCRYGGDDDRLPEEERRMERFRVKALEKHLECEYDAAVRRELIRKYTLLAEGAQKSAEEDEYARYLARIEQLEAGV